MEDTRIRMVGDPSYANKNVITALIKVVHDHGFTPLFSGLFAMLSKQVPYTMAKQVSFDIIKKFLYLQASKYSFTSNHLALIISIGAAFPASILSCIFSQPGDMLLTKMVQSNGLKSTSTVIAELYKEHGLKGFFLGLKTRLVHVMLIITTQLVIYDIVKQATGLKTGSH